MIDVSLIVPIYNAEKYLDKCIKSLVEQTKKEIEIILINDGSTDDSEKIIKKYLGDKRIKYFKNENQGIGKTRNFGIDKANGKYLMFIDSDDYLSKNGCKLLFDKAFSNNLDVVVCDFYKEHNGNIEEVRLLDFKPTSLLDRPELINNINLSPWNKIYKREFIKKNKIKFIENLKYEDAPFVCEAMFKANKIGKVNRCLNYYIIHGNSETTVRDRRVFDIIKIVDIIRKIFDKQDFILNELNKLTVSIITNYTIQQRYQSDKKLRKEFIDKSFLYLKNNVPDYRDKKYYEKRSFFKKLIEKNKILTLVYCDFYNLLKGEQQ